MGNLLGQSYRETGNDNLGRVPTNIRRRARRRSNNRGRGYRRRNNPRRMRGSGRANLEYVKKARQYNSKIGAYLQKLSPLKTHPSADIRKKAKSLRRQFVQKQKKLRAEMESQMRR